MASAEEATRHLECALCLETFTSPKLLPCFHTFCLACLQKLALQVTGGHFLCPTCRANIQIPPGGIEQLQTNFYVEAGLKNLNQNTTMHLCDMCDVPDAVANHICAECEQFACESCAVSHRRIKATRSHVILTFIEQPSSAGPPDTGTRLSKAVSQQKFCETHKDEKLRFYCTKCWVIICRDCKLTAHEGHITTDLSEKSESAKVMLQNVMAVLKGDLQPELNKVFEDAKKSKHEILQKKQQFASLLQERADLIKSQVDICLEEAKLELFMKFEDLELTIDQRLSGMTAQLTTVSKLYEHMEQMIGSDSPVDVLQVPTEMRKIFGEKQVEPAAQGPRNASTFYQAPVMAPSCQLNSKLDIFIGKNWLYDLELTDFDTEMIQPAVTMGFSFGSAYAPANSSTTGPASNNNGTASHPASLKLPATLKNNIEKFIGTVRKQDPPVVQQQQMHRLNRQQRLLVCRPMSLVQQLKVDNSGDIITKLILKIQQVLSDWV